MKISAKSLRKHLSLLALVPLGAIATSCTTTEGAMVGGVAGAVTGAAVSDDGRGALVGGLLGAAAGAAISDSNRSRRTYRHPAPHCDSGNQVPRYHRHAPAPPVYPSYPRRAPLPRSQYPGYDAW